MNSHITNGQGMSKLETGIPGFDAVAYGGLPEGRTTLVTGTAGSAKTVFAVQFLAEGIVRKQPGVFVTFEESPNDIRRNVRGFGWNLPQWETEGVLAFVDGSAEPGQDALTVGSYDLGGLLARIEHAIRKVGAKRIALDSLSSIFTQFSDAATVRSELFRIAGAIKEMGVTAVMTAERGEEYGSISRFGVEEFVADNVIVLRNVLDNEKRRRTLEILKFRGTNHNKGEYPFTVVPDVGMIVIPLSAVTLTQKSSTIRITSGSDELDKMCGGGFFRDSIILVSGATGCGKTLMSAEFISAGGKSGQRCLLMAYEESREQLLRNATGWGIDFEAMEAQGLLRIQCAYPESMSLEDHLIGMKAAIDEFQPTRLALDSLSALERGSTPKAFREFVISVTSYIKHKEMAGMFTSTTASLMGGTSVTEAHISTITDSIVLLRYVEVFGEMRRGLTVLKMRGSPHDKQIREITIDADGMHIGAAFRGVGGILAGRSVQLANSGDGLADLFSAD